MPSKRSKSTNPFYVLLLAVSTAFVLTCFGYLIGPYVLQHEAQAATEGQNPGSLALAGWLDKRGPLLLGIEVVLMVATGLLAMGTDRWFSGSGVARKPGELSGG